MKFHRLPGIQALRLVSDLRRLYAEVYAEPPYNEGEEHVNRFLEHFLDEIKRDGFSLIAAVDGDLQTPEPDGVRRVPVLAGAAYGWTMQAGRWFTNPVTEPPAEIQGVPKFAIMEWMVRKPYRGQGVGRALLDMVLADRPEPYAILASNPASAARAYYDRMGWTFCGGTEGGFMPPMDILARQLGGAGQ